MSQLNPNHQITWPFIGQEKLGGYILRALASNRLPKAILFSGPKSLGKAPAARWLSNASLCRSNHQRPCGSCVDCRQTQNQAHPQQVIVQPSSGGRITIEEIRNALHRFIVIGSAQSDRWLIITDAECLTESAANILLKFLEELPSYTRVVITTSQPEELLLTLKSRLTVFYWHLVSVKILRQSTNKKTISVDRAAGRPGWLLNENGNLSAFSSDNVDQLLGMGGGIGTNELSAYSADRKISDAQLDREELLVRELLLNVCGSGRRQLWPDREKEIKSTSERLGITRLVNLVERYLDRREFSLNIQPRLLYEDLHLV